MQEMILRFVSTELPDQCQLIGRFWFPLILTGDQSVSGLHHHLVPKQSDRKTVQPRQSFLIVTVTS